MYHSMPPYTSYPVTQGHEVTGQIVKLGEYGKDLTVGQKAIIDPKVFCGQCYPCLHGKSNLCEKLHRHSQCILFGGRHPRGERGEKPVKPLQSVHFTFADYLKACQYIDANREKAMKVLIDVDPADE